MIATGSAYSAIPQAEYDALIKAARDGRVAPAIEQLKAWHAADPDDRRIIHDLAALLDRAGDFAAALEYRQEVLQKNSPTYAIKALAHAARMAGRPGDAEAAYRLLLEKTPGDMEAHAGLAYAWMAQNHVPEAFEYVVGKLPGSPRAYRSGDIPLIVALAELHERRGEWLLAASAYQDVSRLDPDFRYALRGRVFALARAGLPFLAQRLAERYAEAFSSEEKARLMQDAAAHMVRYGEAQISAEDTRTRFASTDAALAVNAALPRNMRENPGTYFDRLVALRDRQQMDVVVEVYEELLAAGIATPPYAKFAAADAYLYLQQPQAARDLYIEGLREAGATDSVAMLDSQISLVHAYNESEQHDESEILAEQLARLMPRKINAGLRGLETPAPDYTRVHLLRALLALYNDRLAEAEQRLADLRAQAPFNSDVRTGWASLQAGREHPRAALEEYALLLVDHPKSLDAAVGMAETHLSLHELAEARSALPRLTAEYPENRAVQNLARRVDSYDSPQFRAAATIGRGNRALGAESLYEAALYSAPLAASLGERFRVFGQLARANGPEPEIGQSRTRRGLGLDYRSRDFSAEALVTDTAGASQPAGLTLNLNQSFSDAWHAGLALDNNVIDLPAAAMSEGLRGKALKLQLTWSRNESRQAGGELQRQRYSDGNVRDAMSIWWKERWISDPVFRLESVLSFSAGDNSPEPRTYFNPDRDAELAARLTGEWLGWRSYRRWFKHIAEISVAQYRQRGFGSAPAAGLRYGHEWGFDDAYGLQYGVGRSFHPYDGQRDYRSYVYVTLFGRFK